MTVPPDRPKIYHIANVDRLASMAADGHLFADSEINRRRPPGTTIGMGSIKQRRLTLPVACYAGAMVGDFVPFYFCPRSIMLYVIYRANNPELTYRGGQEPIVHLECDLHRVIDWADAAPNSWAFSDTNAGAAYAQFWREVRHLDQLNWDHIPMRRWTAPDVHYAKQAEFLMYKSFPWNLVDRIGVNSIATFNAANNALAGAAHRPAIELMHDWYY